ncbi:adenosylmethionine--8-amino-7-oxononanoate transaminase [Phenylobacterium sp. Root700]|uniref:adenosylmethionine--8-amino-7-oxononanoate transaminase n=1 Tax=Phenylobacterium sp. Root700 TaxID=1736591 RepID=UPI0006F47833|nr:adenosylmethionine--8-amino-7-oxononanoate transaminase [Phenylobacterium sp. Root700]KRB52142.1 adenosylmethionine-8-amino-7-oxononanoate aminotransferase [Phenylobacterium sp. Root700]
MTKQPDWMTMGAAHVWRPYCQMKTAPAPLAVARTQGARIILEDGRELVDGIASWWTAVHGYNHPHIAAAVTEQLARAPHVMFGGLAHEPAYRLATRLAALLPGDLDHVFFAESGSVSVEIAMKMALQFWINQGVTGKNRFLSFRGGYHGDTLATMTICDPEEGMHSLFAGVMPAQHVVDLPVDAASEAALDAALAQKGAEIAAIIVEPRVQGAGGMLFHGDEVLRTLRRLADKHGVLLIFDEIFVGFGRTGDLFACTGSGVIPDIVTLSKALTGGTLPLSAAIARKPIFEAFWSDDAGAALMHGPTYMGNPLACAAANASLDLFEAGTWKADVARINKALAEGLAPCRAAKGVVDVRTLGAIGVVEFDHPVETGPLCMAFVEQGCWIRPMGKVVYLAPPYVTTDDELARLTGAIRTVLLS